MKHWGDFLMTRVEQLWKILNDEGIYTEKQLYTEMDKVKIDIGIFTNKPEEKAAINNNFKKVMPFIKSYL